MSPLLILKLVKSEPYNNTSAMNCNANYVASGFDKHTLSAYWILVERGHATHLEERRASDDFGPKMATTLLPLAAATLPATEDIGCFRLQDLPAEIRCSIFEFMAAFPRADHLNFLLTSRSMWQQAFQSFFRRPLYCMSQDKLIEFTNRHIPAHLNHVHTLCIQLREVPPDRVEAYLAQMILPIPEKRSIHPYTLEKDRIIQALQKLPNLKHVIFLSTRDGPPHAPAVLLDDVVSYVAKAYTNLKCLSVEDGLYSPRLVASSTRRMVRG